MLFNTILLWEVHQILLRLTVSTVLYVSETTPVSTSKDVAVPQMWPRL